MKHLILAFVLIATSITTALAGKVSREENNADILVGHQKITAKVAALESNLKAHNMTAANITAKDILSLMHIGMTQGMARVNLEAPEKQEAANKVYLQMETASYQYSLLMNDVPGNAAKLVSRAKEFLKLY